MGKYWYLTVSIGLGLAFFVVLYVYQRRRSRVEVGRSWVSYLLLWPLILDVDKDKREGRFFTKREWFGWCLVVLLVVLGMAFSRLYRGG